MQREMVFMPRIILFLSILSAWSLFACLGKCDFAQVDMNVMLEKGINPWDHAWDKPTLLKNAVFAGVRAGEVTKPIFLDTFGH